MLKSFWCLMELRARDGWPGMGAAELEALLLTHPAVQDAAVIPVPHADAGEVRPYRPWPIWPYPRP